MKALCLISLLILLCCSEFTIGVVTVSPSGVAPVCYGGQLELMCTTSVTGMFLQWSFSLIRGNDTTPTHFTRTIIPSVSTNEAMSYLIVNSVTFNFSRISAQNSLPLISQLLIGPADGRLNGTEVNCEDLDSSERAASVINVIECQCTESISDNSVSIQIVSETFGRDGVRVILEWTQDNHTSYSYNVSVTPHTASTLIPERMRVQLNVAYNLPYTVDVLATPKFNNSYCGEGINIIAASIELHYAICPHPAEQVEGSISVIGYKEPALRGTNVTLACSARLILTTLTCVGNGEWEPDPNTVKCKNESTVRKRSLSKDGKIAVASSVTVFTVASILFFIIGFLCGHFCQKKSKLSTTAAAGETVPLGGSGGQTQTPYYDDIVLQQVQLKENVAYGTLR